jgi:membrane protein
MPSEFPERWSRFLPPDDLKSRLRAQDKDKDRDRDRDRGDRGDYNG